MVTLNNQLFVGLLDQYGNHIPIYLMSDNHDSLTINNLSAKVELPGLSTVAYIVTANKDCWIKTGNGSVSVSPSTGRFFLKGTEVIRFPVGHTNIAGLSDDGTTGILGLTAIEGEE